MNHETASLEPLKRDSIYFKIRDLYAYGPVKAILIYSWGFYSFAPPIFKFIAETQT